MDALDDLPPGTATVEFLYPPTLDALDTRLRQQPPVHVVHFDGHGVYSSARGLGYLLFEDDKGRPSRVDADTLGNLLIQVKIPQVRREMGVVHTDLGDVLTDQGHYVEAREAYEAALVHIRAVDDDRSEGVVLGQLGTLALMQRDYAEARRRYQEALALNVRRGDVRGQAIWHHQLGRVAEEQQEWDAAAAYRESGA